MAEWYFESVGKRPQARNAFLNAPSPASFCLFSFFSSTNFTYKTVRFSGIQALIVTVEGKHTDHLTTTITAQGNAFLFRRGRHPAQLLHDGALPQPHLQHVLLGVHSKPGYLLIHNKQLLKISVNLRNAF